MKNMNIKKVFPFAEKLKLKSDTHTKNYIGQNAFGVTKEIRKDNYSEYFIKTPQSSKSTEVFIRMPSQEARQVENKLKLLYMVKLSLARSTDEILGDEYGYTWSEYSNSSKPTLDHPFEYSFTKYFISAEIIEVWIVLQDSGKILKKLSAQK